MSFFDDTVQPVGMLEHDSSTNRTLAVAGFKKAGTPVLLVWYCDEIPSDELKWDRIDLTVKGTAFTDPVYVEMITGKVFELDQTNWRVESGNTCFTQFPVWDSPMMLVDRDQVKLREEVKR